MYGKKNKILIICLFILCLFENMVYAADWIFEEYEYHVPQLVEWPNSIIYHLISSMVFILMIIQVILLILKGKQIKNRYSYMITSIILFLLTETIGILNGSYSYYTQIENEPSKINMINTLVILIGIFIIQITLLVHIVMITNKRGIVNECKDSAKKIN